MIKEINSIKFIYKGEVKLDKITEDKVQEYWKQLQQETDLLHEGKILIVSELIKNEGNYIIELKQTSFSYFMYAKEKKVGDIRCMFSGAYILTSDGYVVCVLNDYYENELHFKTLNLVGGMADSGDIIDGVYSSKNCLKREIKEELGIALDEENWSTKLKYIKIPSESENSVCYPIGTIYEIKTIYTKEQTQKLFEKQSHDKEVNSLVFFSKENYREINNYEHKKQYLTELFEMIFKNA